MCIGILCIRASIWQDCGLQFVFKAPQAYLQNEENITQFSYFSKSPLKNIKKNPTFISRFVSSGLLDDNTQNEISNI